MEKLLHERLREHEGISDDFFVVGEEDGILLSKDEAQAIADEIERYYIARPRFEDGEPVQLWDKFEMENGKACPVTSIGISMNGLRVNPCADSEMAQVIIKDGEFVKRPTPKVYDADGVEIKVGQEVYDIDKEGNRYIVLIPYDDSIDANFTVKCRDLNMGGIEFHCLPSQLTHEKPVFDAEGVRICKGDTVWTKESEDSGTVEIVPYNDDRVLVAWGHPYGRCAEKPGELFHHVPDSLEKLRDFVRGWAHPDNVNDWASGDYCDAMEKVESRLTALIERDEK